MSTIDWNVELRRIERQFDGRSPDPTPPIPRPRVVPPPRPRPKVSGSRLRITLDEDTLAKVGAGARIGITGLLLLALSSWPYATSCGWGLAGFLVAVVMIVLGGSSAALYTWRHRFGIAHVVAMAFVVGGLAMSAMQVLPRMGYASFPGVEATWSCPVR